MNHSSRVSNDPAVLRMSADQYLQTILNREAVDTSVYSPVLNVQATIRPLITRWAATLCSRLVRADPLLRVPQTTAVPTSTISYNCTKVRPKLSKRSTTA